MIFQSAGRKAGLHAPATNEGLQLGHGIFAVEMRIIRIPLTPRRVTSIGPQRFLRGNVFPPGTNTTTGDGLQFGHGVFSVENHRRLPEADHQHAASIGPRHFSPWKRLNNNIFVPYPSGSFNWATAFLRGNQTLATGTTNLPWCFNWATAFSPWKLTNSATYDASGK